MTIPTGIIGLVTSKADEKEAKRKAARELGRRVQEAREEAGMGVNDLDRAIGAAEGSGYTSRLESGDKVRPSAIFMARIASALKVRIEWLLRGEEPKRADAGSRTVERDVPTYSEAEVYFADALAAGLPNVDERTIAAARLRLGRHRGDVTARMAAEALREAIAGKARVREELAPAEQKARVDALRKKP